MPYGSITCAYQYLYAHTYIHMPWIFVVATCSYFFFVLLCFCFCFFFHSPDITFTLCDRGSFLIATELSARFTKRIIMSAREHEKEEKRILKLMYIYINFRWNFLISHHLRLRKWSFSSESSYIFFCSLGNMLSQSCLPPTYLYIFAVLFWLALKYTHAQWCCYVCFTSI